jgi:aminoglycoside phosphotransferase (APT) family kinase protein
MRERWTRTAPVSQLGDEEAAKLLAPVLGAVRIAALVPLSGGHSNTNIRVRLGDRSVVLRLYQRDPAQARKEAAISRLVSGRVPVPRYLHVGERASNGQTYAVVEFVEGETLQSFAKRANESELATAGASVGGVLAAIHGFTFDAAGFFDHQLNVTPFPGGVSNTGFLETCFKGIAGERVGRELADAVIAFAKKNEHRSTVWNKPPRLTHFDFGGTNILLHADGTVSGVVDWEFAAAASPAADFGNLLRPPLGHKSQFVEAVEGGYRAAGGSLPDDWRELTRLADLGAWAEFMTRLDIGQQLIEDARTVFRQTIARGT